MKKVTGKLKSVIASEFIDLSAGEDRVQYDIENFPRRDNDREITIGVTLKDERFHDFSFKIEKNRTLSSDRFDRSDVTDEGFNEYH